ncbi:hypothetical protein HPB47_019646 [Ixodes persulcatus]|uniref:Uncharacterized protein n=1 Tax=Ixodes persulcatus TaxID=34615 RepID=A0AC60QJX0_IXOPE|nr:hypothetical protein HPB47_019646 [Ixodes persulcatus]
MRPRRMLLAVYSRISWTNATRHTWRRSAEEHCGRPAVQPSLDSGDRLIGGRAALPGSWPWQAFLPVQPTEHCGGALIDDQHVITAAHCAV